MNRVEQLERDLTAARAAAARWKEAAKLERHLKTMWHGRALRWAGRYHKLALTEEASEPGSEGGQ